jgi:hypothetical protein
MAHLPIENGDFPSFCVCFSEANCLPMENFIDRIKMGNPNLNGLNGLKFVPSENCKVVPPKRYVCWFINL